MCYLIQKKPEEKLEIEITIAKHHNHHALHLIIIIIITTTFNSITNQPSVGGVFYPAKFSFSLFLSHSPFIYTCPLLSLAFIISPPLIFFILLYLNSFQARSLQNQASIDPNSTGNDSHAPQPTT